MSVHITLHHEPSLVEETHLEIDWLDIEDDDLEFSSNPEPIVIHPMRKVRKVRKVRVTIVEE